MLSPEVHQRFWNLQMRYDPCVHCGAENCGGLATEEEIDTGYGSRFDGTHFAWVEQASGRAEGPVCDACIDRMLAAGEILAFKDDQGSLLAETLPPAAAKAAFMLGARRMLALTAVAARIDREPIARAVEGLSPRHLGILLAGGVPTSAKALMLPFRLLERGHWIGRLDPELCGMLHAACAAGLAGTLPDGGAEGADRFVALFNRRLAPEETSAAWVRGLEVPSHLADLGATEAIASALEFLECAASAADDDEEEQREAV
jgi:hypothetical protein